MNDDTLLHRIIKPGWWRQSGQISSQAFRPAPRDNKRMSVYDGDQIAAAAAWRHYSADPDQSAPIGVLAITVLECSGQQLPVCPDPDTFPGHVLIDFTQFGTNQIRKKSEMLRDAAAARGWQFRP